MHSSIILQYFDFLNFIPLIIHVNHCFKYSDVFLYSRFGSVRLNPLGAKKLHDLVLIMSIVY